LWQDKDHGVVLVLEWQTDDLGSRGCLHISSGHLLAVHEVNVGPTLGIAADFGKLALLQPGVELGLPLGVEVQNVDENDAGVGGDAA